MFFHLETFQRWVRNSLLTTVCKFGVALRPYLAIFVLLYSNQGQRRLCANDDDVRLVPGIDITLRLIHPPIRYDISRMLKSFVIFWLLPRYQVYDIMWYFISYSEYRITSRYIGHFSIRPRYGNMFYDIWYMILHITDITWYIGLYQVVHVI